MSPFPLAEPSRRLVGALLLCAGVGGVQDLAAQQPSQPESRLSEAAERAKREGDKVFQRILLNGAIPRRVGLPAPSDATSAPTPTPAAKPQRVVKVTNPLKTDGQLLRPKGVEEKPPESPVEAPMDDHADLPTPVSEPLDARSGNADERLPQAAVTAASAATASTIEPPQEEEPLVLLNQVEPDYPIGIVRRQKKGSVVLQFVVALDGGVKQIEVVKTTNRFLNPAAIQALSQWKFQPLSQVQTATVEMGFDLAQQVPGATP